MLLSEVAGSEPIVTALLIFIKQLDEKKVLGHQLYSAVVTTLSDTVLVVKTQIDVTELDDELAELLCEAWDAMGIKWFNAAALPSELAFAAALPSTFSQGHVRLAKKQYVFELDNTKAFYWSKRVTRALDQYLGHQRHKGT